MQLWSADRTADTKKLMPEHNLLRALLHSLRVCSCCGILWVLLRFISPIVCLFLMSVVKCDYCWCTKATTLCLLAKKTYQVCNLLKIIYVQSTKSIHLCQVICTHCKTNVNTYEYYNGFQHNVYALCLDLCSSHNCHSEVKHRYYYYVILPKQKTHFLDCTCTVWCCFPSAQLLSFTNTAIQSILGGYVRVPLKDDSSGKNICYSQFLQFCTIYAFCGFLLTS